MKCPNCDSNEVRQMSILSFAAQMSCKKCGHIGTFEEFGVLADLNVGLFNSPDAEYFIEENFRQPDDPDMVIRITVNTDSEHHVVNIWLCEWNQWAKAFPEEIIDGSMTLSEVYQKQVMRIIQDPRFREPRSLMIMDNLMFQARQA